MVLFEFEATTTRTENSNDKERRQKKKQMRAQIVLAALLVALLSCSFRADAKSTTATYMCNTSACTTGCVNTTLPLDTCTYVGAVKLYIQYSCNYTNPDEPWIHLSIFGPWQWMCGDKVHLQKAFPTNQCVLPTTLGGGWTIYRCPPAPANGDKFLRLN
jgi:hypothetical protein